MIFVTVGNTDPFDRLVEAIDAWASQIATHVPVLVQIGRGNYVPKHCSHVRFLSPAEYRDNFSKALIVVAHAGMGSIITALELQKTIIVMPRLAERGELRNQHQLATVRHFRKSEYVLVADSELDLGTVLNKALESIPASVAVEAEGPDSKSKVWPTDKSLVSFVRTFVSD